MIAAVYVIHGHMTLKEGLALLIAINIICGAIYLYYTVKWLHKRFTNKDQYYVYDFSDFLNYVFADGFTALVTGFIVLINAVALFVAFCELIYRWIS